RETPAIAARHAGPDRRRTESHTAAKWRSATMSPPVRAREHVCDPVERSALGRPQPPSRPSRAAREMTAAATASVRLLDADPDLAAGLAGDARALARTALIARIEPPREGPWLPEPPERPERHLGFLVLEGILFRRLPFAERESAELLGP